jgi:hypothetical protein
MKKLKTAFIALLVMGLGTMVNAQDKTTTPAPAKQADKKPAASGQHLKKDGTPDMRYKENKQAPASDKKATTEKKAAPASTEKKADAKPAAAAKSSKKATAKPKTDKAAK